MAKKKSDSLIHVQFRVSQKRKELIKQAARRHGMTMQGFVACACRALASADEMEFSRMLAQAARMEQ
jgi:uncharacterized protein (DUF1778 family)